MPAATATREPTPHVGRPSTAAMRQTVPSVSINGPRWGSQSRRAAGSSRPGQSSGSNRCPQSGQSNASQLTGRWQRGHKGIGPGPRFGRSLRGVAAGRSG